jgi:hypothetical protein
MKPWLQRDALVVNINAAIVSKPANLVLLVLFVLAWTSRGAHALPVYSRQYNVACSMCHSVAPRLTKFGYAFQANHFNWPGASPHPKQDLSKYLPFTTITTASYSNDITGRQETVNFRSFELFFSSGLGLGSARQGGFFVDLR